MGELPGVGLCIQASSLGPVSQKEQCPCVTWTAEARTRQTRTFLDAAQLQPLNKTKDMHCFTGNWRQANEVVLPSIRGAVCMAVHDGWTCGFHSSWGYGVFSGEGCMYLLRKYEMNLLCLHLLVFPGMIPSGAQSHSQHLSVMVHPMTTSAVWNASVRGLVLQSHVLSLFSGWWRYVLSTLGYCGENVVGAFGVLVVDMRNSVCVCAHSFCFNLTWRNIPCLLDL